MKCSLEGIHGTQNKRMFISSERKYWQKKWPSLKELKSLIAWKILSLGAYKLMRKNDLIGIKFLTTKFLEENSLIILKNRIQRKSLLLWQIFVWIFTVKTLIWTKYSRSLAKKLANLTSRTLLDSYIRK